MTFCLGIKVNNGLVALADTRVVRGEEMLSKGKVEIIRHHGRPVFVMTSGLRSIRDKTMTYLKESLAGLDTPLDKLYQVANAFGNELRKAKAEDGAALESNGFSFNTHAIIGGQLALDEEPKLYYIYPAGNWIESTKESPYFMIGRSSYGKPILDRLLHPDVELATALNLAFLAFDATRTSVTDVDFPIDMVTCVGGAVMKHHSFTELQLHDLKLWWQQCLSTALDKMPREWAHPLLQSRNAEGDS